MDETKDSTGSSRCVYVESLLSRLFLQPPGSGLSPFDGLVSLNCETPRRVIATLAVAEKLTFEVLFLERARMEGMSSISSTRSSFSFSIVMRMEAAVTVETVREKVSQMNREGTTSPAAIGGVSLLLHR